MHTRSKLPCAAAARSVPVGDLPNPYAHERSDTNLEDSLRAAVWEVLQRDPDGLEAEAVADRISRMGPGWKLKSGITSEQVLQVLKDEIYFVPADTRFENGQPTGNSSTWRLAVLIPIKWGIAGTGQIAEDVVSMMDTIPGTQIHAIGARKSEDTAKKFADEHGGCALYDSMEKAARDPEVDAVYVNAIHITHKDLAIEALEAGKHVLCEKPIAIHANLTRDMIRKAQEKDRFLTEGLWSRFFPASQKVKQLIQDGVIGDVKHVTGQICINMTDTPRLYDLDMGGGGLLDIGLYMISLASWVFDGRRPDDINAFGALADTGADVAGCINLRYGDSAMAQLYYSIEFDAPIEAVIHGTEGRIKIHHRAHNPEAITLYTVGEDAEEQSRRMEFPNPPRPADVTHGSADGGFNYPGSAGFIWQAMAVHSAILKGRKEMDDITHEETVMLMELCDELRDSSKLNVTYQQDACKERD